MQQFMHGPHLDVDVVACKQRKVIVTGVITRMTSHDHELLMVPGDPRVLLLRRCPWSWEGGCCWLHVGPRGPS